MLQGWESEFSLIVLHMRNTALCLCVCLRVSVHVCVCVCVCVPVSVSVSLSQGFQSLNPITSSNLQPSRERERELLSSPEPWRKKENLESSLHGAVRPLLIPEASMQASKPASKHASKQTFKNNACHERTDAQCS